MRARGDHELRIPLSFSLGLGVSIKALPHESYFFFILQYALIEIVSSKIHITKILELLHVSRFNFFCEECLYAISRLNNNDPAGQ